MKRFRLPKGAKAAVREWLELPGLEGRDFADDCKENTCPFIDVPRPRCSKVCEGVFPRTKLTGQCPCHQYTLDYVIRRAKEIIR